VTVNKRRSLTPNAGMPNVSPASQARRGGVRRTVSDRVTFRAADGTTRRGWALNVSEGGIRAILDDDTGKVELGEDYAISLGDAESPEETAKVSSAKKGRIVWLQEEPDGFVVGVEYEAAPTKAAATAKGPGAGDGKGEGRIEAPPKDGKPL